MIVTYSFLSPPVRVCMILNVYTCVCGMCCYVCACGYLYVYVYVCMNLFVHVYIFIRVCICVCVCESKTEKSSDQSTAVACVLVWLVVVVVVYLWWWCACGGGGAPVVVVVVYLWCTCGARSAERQRVPGTSFARRGICTGCITTECCKRRTSLLGICVVCVRMYQSMSLPWRRYATALCIAPSHLRVLLPGWLVVGQLF